MGDRMAIIQIIEKDYNISSSETYGALIVFGNRHQKGNIINIEARHGDSKFTAQVRAYGTDDEVYAALFPKVPAENYRISRGSSLENYISVFPGVVTEYDLR